MDGYSKKWAHLGSNQGLLACKASALPLSYAPLRRATVAGDGIAARVPVPPTRRHREDSPGRHVPASISVLDRLT